MIKKTTSLRRKFEMIIKGLKITERFENDEPQSCEYYGCQEDINGLNHLMIKPFRYFCFDIWLCEKHLKLFKSKIKKGASKIK